MLPPCYARLCAQTLVGTENRVTPLNIVAVVVDVVANCCRHVPHSITKSIQDPLITHNIEANGLS